MNEPEERFRSYVARFGIAREQGRVAPVSLPAGEARCFVYTDDSGMTLKAVVTSGGLVTPGRNAGDDWYGFLVAADANEVASCIAWLESDGDVPTHGYPAPRMVAVDPSREPVEGVDPGEAALVAAPKLRLSAGVAELVAWFRAEDVRTLVRWTVVARAGAPADLTVETAKEILARRAGSAEAAAREATKRARRALADGSEGERAWALWHVGEVADGAAIAGVVALLDTGVASPGLRVLAARTLGLLASSEAVAALGAALRDDPAPEVRRACAQALGSIGGHEAVLRRAAGAEPDPTVRAEIAHALDQQ